MPIIKPKGLLRGERIRTLSDEAKLFWPFIYAASNGYGRFVIDYLSILNTAFGNFNVRPSEETIRRVLTEYRDKHLLFIYRAPSGQVWGAFDSASGQQYFTDEDRESPAPPEPAFEEWMQRYRENKVREAPAPAVASALGAALYKDGDFSIENGPIFVSKEGVFEAKNGTPHTTQHSVLVTAQEALNTTQQESEIVENEEVPPEPLEDPAASEAVGREGWSELIEVASRAGMSLDPSPASDLCRNVWRYRDFGSRKSCIDGIRERIDCGQYSQENAQYVPTLSNYVRRDLWRESMRPRIRGQPPGRESVRMPDLFLVNGGKSR